MKKSIVISAIAAFTGIAGGYAYYHFIGCQSGACPLQSNAVFMSAYGGFTGLLLGNIINSFMSKRKNKNE